MLTSGTLMNPKHPVYIISKGRWDSRHTSIALEKMNMPYSIVVEEQEYDQYASVINKDKILILPKQYIEDYDACNSTLYYDGSFITDHGTSKGSGPARNFCWEHALENGATSHWLLDDNIKAFGRINRNLYIHVTSGTIFKALKDGWCTIQFNAFIQEKATTQTMKGGNEEIYKNGTLDKSKMLARLHPDVAEVVWKFNRWHHKVDYKPFKKNELKKKKGLKIKKGINNYGMKVVKI